MQKLDIKSPLRLRNNTNVKSVRFIRNMFFVAGMSESRVLRSLFEVMYINSSERYIFKRRADGRKYRGFDTDTDVINVEQDKEREAVK